MVSVCTINLPEYTVDKKPDFELLGSKIDTILKENFLGQNVVLRALGVQEHPGKTTEELIQIVQDTGTDRYDPTRKGDRYENIEGKHIDFFGMPFLITKHEEYLKNILEPFYFYPPKLRGVLPIRIDIVIIYDPKQIEVVEHQYEGREGETKTDGYIFKDQNNKTKALKGLIHIK